MNTRLDPEMYNISKYNCTVCGNPAITPRTSEKPYCVRCNITLPEGFTKIRRRPYVR